MDRTGRALLAASLLAALALAGCADAPVPEAPLALEDEDAEIAEDGRDLRYDMGEDDVLPSPEWAVGDWFGHHMFLGPTDEEGTHVNVVVAEADSSSYLLVTDNEQAAKWEAMFDIPILGIVSSADLSTQSFGEPWKLYDFPMRDGHKWTGDLGYGEPVQFEATYNAAIETPYGKRPGFDITGDLPGNVRLLETDYVPDIGWYSYFNLYNINTEEPDDTDFRSISMGRGKDWSGTYHLYRGPLVIEHQQFFAPVTPDGQLDPESMNPVHYEAAMIHDADILIGWMGAFALQGYSEIRLTDPDNQQYTYSAPNVEASPDFNTWEGTFSGTPNFEMWEVPAKEGEWRLSQLSAGFVGGVFINLWALQGEQVDMLSPET